MTDLKLRVMIDMYQRSITESKPKLENARKKGFHQLAEHYKETILIAESKIDAYTEMMGDAGNE